MKLWKLIGKIEKEYDFNTKSYIHFLSYGGVSKMQLPQNDKISLNLTNNFLVFQIVLISPKSFTIEISITDTTNIKRRIIFTSSSRDISYNNLHCRIPLLNFPINKWTNFEINVSSLVKDCFKQLALKCIDSIHLSANCKIRKIYSLKNSIVNVSPKGLNLPMSLEILNYHYESIIEGLTQIKEKHSLIEIENGLGKVIAQTNNEPHLDDNTLNVGSDKKIYDLKQLRSRSTNKPFKDKKTVKENGNINSNNNHTNNQSANEIDNNSRSNIHEGSNQKLTHFQELHKKYQSLNKKTKNNIKFAKKIPSIEQVQSQIKYDISGRKLPSYFIESSSKGKKMLKKESNNFMNKNQIETNPLSNNANGAKFPLHRNDDNTTQKTPVKQSLKTNNYTSTTNKNKEKEEKLLNTFNINNLYKQQATNLCDSIEEIYDYNENGTIVDDSIANGRNIKENNQSDIIHIDKGRFPTNISNQKIEVSKDLENDKDKKEFLEELCNEDYINFTLESNRPFTPPISKLVPVKVDNKEIKNNNLISPLDKQTNSKPIINKASHINYDNLIYDEDIGYYYNPITKMYYDLKDQ